MYTMELVHGFWNAVNMFGYWRRIFGVTEGGLVFFINYESYVIMRK